MTFKNAGGTGNLVCFPARPCHNVSLEDVHIENLGDKAGWGCSDVASGRFVDVTPPRETSGNCNFTSS